MTTREFGWDLPAGVTETEIAQRYDEHKITCVHCGILFVPESDQQENDRLCRACTEERS